MLARPGLAGRGCTRSRRPVPRNSGPAPDGAASDPCRRLSALLPLVLAAGPALLAACAAPDAEIHLAPLVSRHTVPGYDRTELLGGILRREERDGHEDWAVSPLLWQRSWPDGRVQADFLYPLGRFEHDPDRPRTWLRLFPVFWREAETRPDGVLDVDWSFLFPFFWGGWSSDGQENYFAFFPVFGRLRDFLTYDEVDFVLWPLYLRNVKDQRRSYHLLWPIFGWIRGSERGWRVFPFYGRSEVPGQSRGFYVLWPFFHSREEELYKKEPRQGWLLLPLGGRITQGDYRATTVLWPFFGLASRPSTGYSSWQVWPILKFERGGRETSREVSRILPFWLHFADDETEYTAWLWPLFWVRHDHFGGLERESFYAIPFYQHSRSRRADGGGERLERFWPLARVEEADDGREWFSLPAPGLEPILDSRALSRNLGFAFELWAGEREKAGGPRRRRAFLDLYHEAEAGGHRRWSLPVLGGQWTEPDGTRHTSLLLGLLRFASGPDGTRLEAPAFPGPGWPDLHSAPGASFPPAPEPEP